MPAAPGGGVRLPLRSRRGAIGVHVPCQSRDIVVCDTPNVRPMSTSVSPASRRLIASSRWNGVNLEGRPIRQACDHPDLSLLRACLRPDRDRLLKPADGLRGLGHQACACMKHVAGLPNSTGTRRTVFALLSVDS